MQFRLRVMRLACFSVVLFMMGGVSAFADGEGGGANEQGTLGQLLLGNILSIEGEQYSIRAEDGNTRNYHVSKETMLNSSDFKAGDQVIGSVTKEGHVIALTKRMTARPGA